MTDHDEEGFGFAPEHDAPIPYMQRIRDYYQALGYGAAYRWAHYAEVPFAPLNKPLVDSRVGLADDGRNAQPRLACDRDDTASAEGRRLRRRGIAACAGRIVRSHAARRRLGERQDHEPQPKADRGPQPQLLDPKC